MDIKNKSNDIKLNKIPINIMPKVVKSINDAIAEGMGNNMKLLWTNDLEYEFVEYEGNLYRDKASEYGADSLYVLMSINEKSNELKDYSIFAVWQNKKFLGRGESSYKTVSAILNNNFYGWQKPTWLIIKNPKIIDYSNRYTSEKSPQQQKDILINNAYKNVAKEMKIQIANIKMYTKGTVLENDNPLEVTKNIADLISVDFDNYSSIKRNALYSYLSKLETTYEIRSSYNSLIDLYIKFINVIRPETISPIKINKKRQDVFEAIKKNKNFPEKPYREEIIDKSGYVTNLTKWLEKKWDKFKNSNNNFQAFIYEMQSEYNDLIFETKIKIKELIIDSSEENWKLIEKFSNKILKQKDTLKYINEQIDEFIDYYKKNNEPIDTDSWSYGNIIKDIKKFIASTQEAKQEVI